MKNEIDINENNIKKYSEDVLKILLKDRTTKKNIVWATNDYQTRGEEYSSHEQIKIWQITGENNNVIQPRVAKGKEKQCARTRGKAEVFTPSWICNQQNNLVDEAWFDKKNVFNVEGAKTWQATTKKIDFPNNKTWKNYVEFLCMEITCGEAPYLVSRYDTVTGKYIDINERIGLLDRKMRIVNENTKTEKDWMTWTRKAFKSIYGFEYQGDSLLLARENLLYTFIEYYRARFSKEPDEKYLKEFAEIISWNIWQMDGLKFTVPLATTKVAQQVTLFEDKNTCKKQERNIDCKIKDWTKRSNNLVAYRDLLKGGK